MAGAVNGIESYAEPMKKVNNMSKRVTVRDIAQQTGVSIATVSRVLNGQAHVAPHTRDLIQRVVTQLGDDAPSARTTRPTPGAGVSALPVPS